MKKLILSIMPFIMAFALSGCNDELEQNAKLCRYYVQQDMAQDKFDSALQRLETQSCQDSYPNETYKIDKGTAYMGRAGTSLTDVIGAMIDAEDDGDTDGFQTFAESMSRSTTATALPDLLLAHKAFDDYLGERCNLIANPTGTQNGVCFLDGFISVIQSTMAIEALAGGNIDNWLVSDSQDLSLKRSTCALQYIHADAQGEGAKFDYNVSCDDISALNKNAGDAGFTNATYTLVEVTSNDGEAEQFLHSPEQGVMVVTSGYCDLDYTEATKETEGAYPCPALRGVADELSMEHYLVDALNTGFDNIEHTIAISGQDENGEIQESIDEFKAEIGGNGTAFTLDDIITYINKD